MSQVVKRVKPNLRVDATHDMPIPRGRPIAPNACETLRNAKTPDTRTMIHGTQFDCAFANCSIARGESMLKTLAVLLPTVIAISFAAYKKGYRDGVADGIIEDLQRSHPQADGEASCD